jgi:hypothetical protein
MLIYWVHWVIKCKEGTDSCYLSIVPLLYVCCVKNTYVVKLFCVTYDVLILVIKAVVYLVEEFVYLEHGFSTFP